MTVNVAGFDLPDYVSYSALTTWSDCGWKYILTRSLKVPEQPSFWLAGGSAVHEATEISDLAKWNEANSVGE